MDVALLVFLILLNAAFAMSEMALTASRKARLQVMVETGEAGAQAALDLHDNPTKFLSVVQIGITSIGVLNGIVGEAAFSAPFASWLNETFALGDRAAGIAATAMVVIVITFATIILGELVPKRIAMQYPEAMATLIAQPLRILSKLMAPFVKVLSLATEAIVRVLGIRDGKDDAPTEEDITGMIKEGTDAGLFEKTEYDIVSRALRLDDRHLKALMTPRVDLVILDLEADRKANLDLIANNPYSRFPVYRGDRSHILGYVMARDLFAQSVRHGSLEAINLDAAVQPLLYVPETVSAMALLELFKKNRVELALIVDEYGDIQGMVTLSDVMSALVGDVTVIGEEHDPDAVQRQDGSWLLDGGMPLDRFRDLMNTATAFPDEDSGAYHTLAGFVLYKLGYIPKVSEFFDWSDYRFEVVDMDGNRIDRVLVCRRDQVPARRP